VAADAYEGLRDHWLSSRHARTGDSGLSVLLHSGMRSWLDVICAASCRIRQSEVSAGRVNTSTPSPARSTLVHIMAAIVGGAARNHPSGGAVR